jgi:hypothetical protein
MLKKFASVSSADGHAERDRRDVQALILIVSLFPPVSHISRGDPAGMFSSCATHAQASRFSRASKVFRSRLNPTSHHQNDQDQKDQA